MAFELWDIETANLVGDYPTEEAALDVVRTSIREHGPEAVAALALAYEDDAGETRPIVAGAALMERAQGAMPAATRS